MRIAQCLGLAVAAALASPAPSQPLKTSVDAVSDEGPVDSTTITQDIEFAVDRNDRMTVPVTVGGSGPYRFLVDTGADRTAVSAALASQLGLAPGPDATLHSVTGKSKVRTAIVPRLGLGADRVRSVEAALLDRGHMGADGILGVDSLRSQRVMFDFKKRMISIVPSAKRVEREDGTTIVVRGKLKRGHLIVTDAKLNGSPISVVLDTGSEMTMGNWALRRKLELSRKLGEPERTSMISVTGERLVGEAVLVKELKIGEVSMRDLAIFFSDAPIFAALDLDDRPAMLLGMNAMRAFDKISIDFARKKLRMVLPEQGMLDPATMAAR